MGVLWSSSVQQWMQELGRSAYAKRHQSSHLRQPSYFFVGVPPLDPLLPTTDIVFRSKQSIMETLNWHKEIILHNTQYSTLTLCSKNQWENFHMTTSDIPFPYTLKSTCTYSRKIDCCLDSQWNQGLWLICMWLFNTFNQVISVRLWEYIPLGDTVLSLVRKPLFPQNG